VNELETPSLLDPVSRINSPRAAWAGVPSRVEKRVVFSQEIADNNLMKKKILVVEDEESLRLLYEEELKTEGYEVLTAGNGREAIQQLEQGKPDLIILDIVMPVMDGMEALGRIVGKERKIPIILNTSYSGYRQDFMSWAADAYVTKSDDLTELKKKIRDLLEISEKSRNP
jgi:two-component system response regulator (stage 0 sporulation protein F)